MSKKKVKTPIGLRNLFFAPIRSKPENDHPTYGQPFSLGAAVKAYVSVTTVAGEISGDDQELLNYEGFKSAQVDTETTLDDLEISAQLYGHTLTEDGEEVSGADDVALDGGLAFTRTILTGDKKIKHRATFLYLATALPSSEKEEGDTKKGDFNPKMSPASFKATLDNAKVWRSRKEFENEADAVAWIMAKYGAGDAYPVTIDHVGVGASKPGEGTAYVPRSSSLTVDFTPKKPAALYDNQRDVTAQMSGNKYTLSTVTEAHELTAIWTK